MLEFQMKIHSKNIQTMKIPSCIIIILNSIIFYSCNQNTLEGIYVYENAKNKTRSNTTSLFDFTEASETGRQMGCEILGQFEFKNGKCYFNTMGIEQRTDYEIDNGVIYLGSNKLTNSGVGLKIIDKNTIEFMGCIFIKSVQ